ncbi:Pre-mRNA-splicing factor of RES complex-domain-containing protein [Apodospora peruviana]|uniref:Pre-mRNA-splicing factor of RES complex-domain-containing protein n=1 Tax=Apodospora peruviana TaxID=516989 RepID=A0AAE0I6A3_9PEZI|nr:Pre-mRNA-splicing factor of RES complex-domain-containing protein [Apodospora peruviana]
MPPSDKAAYLAAHYLTVEKPKSSSSKKRKRSKHATASNNEGLIITDDDDPGWGTTHNTANGDDKDGDIPVVTVAGTSAEFRRAKKSGWKTIGAPIPTDTKDARDNAAAAAADAIIASAAAETAAARAADDDAPVVDGDGDVPMMADGTHAGLQSAAALTAQLKRRQKAEREELARMKAEQAATTKNKESADEPEIILRDATGRRVDISMRRAEMRRAAQEAEKAEEAKRVALKGEVQLEQARQRKEALQDAPLMPLARGRDDEEMNREMKAAQRWNDPMAQFMDGGGDDTTTGRKGSSSSNKNKRRRPVYKGPAPPNRYGIRPGYRWDGVDRSNGFEAERFKAINRKERNKTLDYAWQMDE